ncbi:hypothetical protein [Halorubrum sp. Ea8]|uniref:hypothetical protein n=1 Tax=Halorubrum sp. Ea8 TaxID=1383841 RepID=UPI00113FD29B|nr:hypothetical protein [Halorubrum sp. Ea8]
MTDEGWEIEGEFRDGSKRVRDDDGQYQSVSTAILEELSEYEVVDKSDIASRIGVEETVALEHLIHLKKKGLLHGKEGAWSKEPRKSEKGIPPEDSHAFEWENKDSEDSIY